MSDTRSTSTAGDYPVRAAIEDSRINGEFVKVFLICLFVMFMDGWDLFGISYVASDMVKALDLPKASISGLFLATGIGFIIGALTIGWFADKQGRRSGLALCTVIFASGSILTALSRDATMLFAARMIVGIGLGGVGPSACALVSEYAPKKLSHASVMVINMGVIVGGISSGLYANLTHSWGWQSMFWFGGLAPVVLLALILFVLPESIDFTLRKRGSTPAVLARLRRIRPDVDWGGATRPVADPIVAKSPVAGLFAGDLRTLTPLLWVLMMAALTGLFFYATWLPVILKGLGFSAEQILSISGTAQAGSFIGATLLARFIGRFQSFVLLGVCYATGGVVLLVCSVAPVDPVLWIGLGFLLGFFVGGTQIAAAAVIVMQYPTDIRGTGAGWANGIGRIGGILCPIIVGMLIKAGWGDAHLFAFAAAAPCLAGLLCIVIASRGTGSREPTGASPLVSEQT